LPRATRNNLNVTRITASQRLLQANCQCFVNPKLVSASGREDPTAPNGKRAAYRSALLERRMNALFNVCTPSAAGTFESSPVRMSPRQVP
jgi:hypothetical protein